MKDKIKKIKNLIKDKLKPKPKSKQKEEKPVEKKKKSKLNCPKCPNCGEPILNDDKFCEHCLHDVNETHPQEKYATWEH